MRVTVHYESPDDGRRARWWAIVLFYVTVLLIAGGGWLLGVWEFERRPVAPAPTPSPAGLAWGGSHDR